MESNHGFWQTNRNVAADEKKWSVGSLQRFHFYEMDCLHLISCAFDFDCQLCEISFGSRLELETIMPDVSCQTLMVHISSLRWEDTQDALNKIFDQGIRSNMRLQDARSRLKDLQDDMRVVKRHLNLEDAQGKRLKLAVDPTEGPAKDYLKDEMDKKTKKLGSESESDNSYLLEHDSDLSGENKKRQKLWEASQPELEKAQKAQAPHPPFQSAPAEAEQGGSLRQQPTVEAKAQTTKDEKELMDPFATAREPAESSYEEDNTDPEEPEVGTVVWIIFEGENEEPVRMDKLSPAQEMMLENGKRYRFFDIQDHHRMMEKVAETARAWETKGMDENDISEEAALPAENVVKEKNDIVVEALPAEENVVEESKTENEIAVEAFPAENVVEEENDHKEKANRIPQTLD